MRRVSLVAACFALLWIAPGARADDCTPVPPVQGCPSASPTPSPTPTPTASGGSASAQGAQSVDSVDLERQFFDLVNHERSTRGMSRLAYNPKLTEVARRHSSDMASSGRLYHNTSELRSAEFNRAMGYPEMVGENVGEGPSVEWLHKAFMDSTGHRANILEPRYTSLGVGVVVRDGTIWVTQDYIRGGSRVVGGFPKARPARPRPATVLPYRQVLPQRATTSVAGSAPLAARAVKPMISALRLPPIPAPLAEDSEKDSPKPLLPLAVLATLSAVAFASRRDAGAWI